MLEDERALEDIKGNIMRTQKYIITIHGPHSDRKQKEELPSFHSEESDEFYEKEETNLYIDRVDTLTTSIYSSSPSYMEFISKKINPFSFFFNGLEGNTVYIDKKFNHLLIRKCKNTNFYIKEGNISGIDILTSQNMCIHVPLHDFTNIEYTSDTKLFGTIKNHSKIMVRNSSHISFENVRLPVNFFEQKSFDVNFFDTHCSYKSHTR